MSFWHLIFSGIKETMLSPTGGSSSDSIYVMKSEPYVPDFSVRATTNLQYLLIKRGQYIAARRATLLSLSQNASPQDDTFTKEWTKATLLLTDKPTMLTGSLGKNVKLGKFNKGERTSSNASYLNEFMNANSSNSSLNKQRQKEEESQDKKDQSFIERTAGSSDKISEFEDLTHRNINGSNHTQNGAKNHSISLGNIYQEQIPLVTPNNDDDQLDGSITSL